MYLNADGVEEDINKAVDLLTKSANQNNLSSMIKLADLYEKGKVVSQDYSKAFYWYNKALDFDSLKQFFRLEYTIIMVMVLKR